MATVALLERVPRRSAGDTKYTAGSVLVVGGQPGMTGAACLSALAAFRADAGYVTLAVPSESVSVAETLVLEAVKVGWNDDDAVETIAAAAERAGAIALGPGLGRGPGRRALVRGSSRDDRPSRGGGRRRALRARAVRTCRSDGAHAARRRARTAARYGRGVGGCAPARGCPQRSRAFRRRRRAQGLRHDRRRTRKRGDRLRSRPTRARDRRNRRCADGNHGSVSRQGSRRAARSRGGRNRARPRRAARAPAARASSRAISSISSRGLSKAEPTWSARASRSISEPSGATRRRSCALPAARSCGPSSRRTDTATAPPTSRTLRFAAARPLSASRPWTRRSSSEQFRLSTMHASSSWARPTNGSCVRRSVARLELVVAGGPDSRGHSPAPEDRHGHGQMGPVRASRSDQERRRRHEPSRMLPSPTRTSRACRSSASAKRPLTSATRSSATSRTAPGTLRYPAASFDAVRCGIALYGISPFGSDPALDGLEPALRWESYVALAKRLEPRRQHRLRAPIRRGRADLDRSRSGGLRGRLPA